MFPLPPTETYTPPFCDGHFLGKVWPYKTKIISPSLQEKGTDSLMAIPVVPKAKVLGIWIGADRSEEANYLWNFKEPLCRIQNVCEAWNNRNLSIKGKVTVANALLISLLQYPCSIIHTPSRVIEEYRKLISRFLWKGHKSKIAYSSITKPICQGDLLELETQIKVSHLQWIRRWINRPEMSTAISLSHILQTNNLVRFFNNKDPILFKKRTINSFYSGINMVSPALL